MESIETSDNIWERRLPLLVVSVLGALFVTVLYRTAWLCDDAYITYRTIDNAIHGHGLRYNPGERVQAFTHPLWMFLHLPFRLLSDNMWAVGMLVALGTSLSAMVWVLWKLTRNYMQMAFFLLAAVFSHAFVDYSTSGLENPLTHLLIGAFAGVWLGPLQGRRKLFWLAMLTGLALTNRMDTVLLFAPALGLECWRQRSWGSAGTVLLGFSVFIFWEIFSVIYYGFPFPNTAYAKLNHGFESSLMWRHGFYYFWNSLSRDPLTLLTIFSAAILVFVYRQKRLVPLALGMVLYLLYVLKIGGGFMSGRFFTGPFFLALILLIHHDHFPRNLPALGRGLALVVLLGWLPGNVTLLSGKGYAPPEEGGIDAHGIADERAFYYGGTGLLQVDGVREIPDFRWVKDGKEMAASPDSVHHAGNMGFLGYYAGPRKHLIDTYALTDPLMSRLPNRFMPDWRPGHFERMMPLGYKASLESGTNQLHNPALKALYDEIKLVTQGPLFSAARWRAILRLNLGIPQAKVDREKFFLPVTQTRTYAELATPRPDTLPWDAPGNVMMTIETGLAIKVPAEADWARLSANVCSKCWYIVVIRAGEQRLHSFVLRGKAGDFMHRVCTELPTGISVRNPDEILIYPLTDWRRCSLSDLQLLSGKCPEEARD